MGGATVSRVLCVESSTRTTRVLQKTRLGPGTVALLTWSPSFGR